MPRPVSSQATYMPGLDGLRAFAVVAVLGYHLGVPFLTGGLLGVGMFFTLSGFLITFILLRTWDQRGDLHLRVFWLRRARRLLPAVILLLVVVLVATALVAPTDFPARARESVAAMFYVSNWTTIAADTSYFDAFNGPGTLDHLWSLAVEEQFYLVWPLLLLAMLTGLKGRVRRVALVTLGIALASFLLMMVVADPGFDNTRAYEGTDTRAGGLLLGAALAMVWRPDRLQAVIAPRARLIVDGLGVAALAVLSWQVVTTDPFSLSLYRGGLFVLSVATALLVAVVVHPASRVARVMGAKPLVWIGERSYGIYLWHLPVIVFTPDTVLADAPLLRGAMQVVLGVGLAAVSWTVVEDPIRKHGLLGAIRAHRADRQPLNPGAQPLGPGTQPRFEGASLPALLRGTGVVIVLGVLVLALLPVIGGTARNAVAAAEPPPGAEPSTTPTEPSAPAAPTTAPATPDQTPSATPTASPTPSATPTPAGDPKTSCDQVVHIGDSTSRGLFNPDQLPDPATRLDARYQAVGAEEVIDEVFPAMSVVETYEDEPNADDRVATLVDNGYDGCWVFALGLQDAANQSVGGVVELPDRIDTLMEQIGDMPALWSTGYAIEQDGPWSDPELLKWNEAVVEACDRWPNMRVWDWRSEAEDQWYDADGIHFNPEGDVVRAEGFADALAVAFPASGEPPADCLVSTE